MQGKARVLVVSGFFCMPDVKAPRYVEIARKNHEEYCKKNGYDYRFFSDYDKTLPSGDKSAFYRGCNSKPWHITRVMEERKEISVVMWIDIDSLFMSYERVERLMGQGESVVVAGDCSDYANSGHIIVRNDDAGKEIIKLWRDLMNVSFTSEKRQSCSFSLTSDGYIKGDQTALVAVLGGAGRDGDEIIGAFNMLNLYEGNCDRWLKVKKKANSLTDEGLKLGQDIVDRTWHGKVKLMKQRSMNSYLVGPIGGLYRREDWVIHFVGDTREVISKDALWKTSSKVPGGKRLGTAVAVYMVKRKFREVMSRMRNKGK